MSKFIGYGQVNSLLRSLKKQNNAWPFLEPVNPVELGIPDYFQIITHPMDFGTIQKKIDKYEYNNAHEFEMDCLLVFSNCKKYNPETSEFVLMAVNLQLWFEPRMAKLKESILEKEIQAREAAEEERVETERLRSLGLLPEPSSKKSKNNHSDNSKQLLPVRWLNGERESMIEAFIAFDINLQRWDSIVEKSNCERSKIEIFRFIVGWLKQCVPVATGEDKILLQQCLDIVSMSMNIDPNSVQINDSLLTPNYVKLLPNKTKLWARRFRLMKVLTDELGAYQDNWSEYKPEPMGRPITLWWQAEHDRDLLIGTFKHGLNYTFEIFCDQELCFHNNVGITEAPEKPPTFMEVKAIENQRKKEKAQKLKEKNKKKEQKKDLKEMEFLQSQLGMLTKDSGAQSTKNPEDSDSSEEEEIVDGRRKIQTGSPQKKKKAIGDDETELTTAWPFKRTLEARVRYLLGDSKKKRFASERKHVKNMKDRYHQQTKFRTEEERAKFWSKREQQDFRSQLLAHGPGLSNSEEDHIWKSIKEKANLKFKSIEAMDLYHTELIVACQEVVENAAKKPAPKKKKKKKKQHLKKLKQHQKM